MKEYTIKSVPFSWNDNFSEVALEDFSMIQKKLSYGTCHSIGMALAKLEILEKQGCKVKEQNMECKTDCPCNENGKCTWVANYETCKSKSK